MSEQLSKKEAEIIAGESFIRRASTIHLPFMLKGSYVTRQYFPDPDMRTPRDLDWVYLHKLTDEQTAKARFDEWVIIATELKSDDGVVFESFSVNPFWRLIDYAMADDFPTVNTDLYCTVDGMKICLHLDISFNLDMEGTPTPLEYQPRRGPAFIIPSTPPPGLQVSWKIHQTLVRPRFKDLADLMFLVQHPFFNRQELQLCLQALVNECFVDNIPASQIQDFLNFKLDNLFKDPSIKSQWSKWLPDESIIPDDFYVENVQNITGPGYKAAGLNEFLKQFEKVMQQAGFGIHLMDELPLATRKQQSTSGTPPVTGSI